MISKRLSCATATTESPVAAMEKDALRTDAMSHVRSRLNGRIRPFMSVCSSQKTANIPLLLTILSTTILSTTAENSTIIDPVSNNNTSTNVPTNSTDDYFDDDDDEFETIIQRSSQIAMALGWILVVASLGCALFVYWFREKRVRGGCTTSIFISAVFWVSLGSTANTIVRVVAASGVQLSVAIAADWFWFLSVLCIHSALFSKLWRVYKVTQFRRHQRVKPRHVIWPFIVIMATALAVLIASTVLIYDCVNSGLDDKKCSVDLTWEEAFYKYFLPALVLFNALLCAIMAWKVRKAPEGLSDVKRIFQTLISHALVACVCVPLEYTTTIPYYDFFSLMAWLWAMFTLLFMIVPKMYYVWYEHKHGHLPEKLRQTMGATGRTRVDGIDLPADLKAAAEATALAKQEESRNGLQSAEQTGAPNPTGMSTESDNTQPNPTSDRNEDRDVENTQ